MKKHMNNQTLQLSLIQKVKNCCTEKKSTRTRIKNTPDQMLKRLPISLAQLKANSEKLKNEIRPLLYSLYRSKKLIKTIYNNLITNI